MSVPVPPQLRDRRTERAVYCSCRCANAEGKTDDGANYCKCPSGFKCQRLIDNLGLGSEQLAGGYCIRNGTAFDPNAVGGSNCDRLTKNCGDAQPF